MTDRMILAVNPGGTSTKIGLFRDAVPVFEENIHHDPEELSSMGSTFGQLDHRKNLVLEALERKGHRISELAAVVGRGGTFKPLASGTYRVTEKLLADIQEGSSLQADHPSNLGAPIAWSLASREGIPAYFVDPVCVDEMEEVARFSGHPLLPRVSLSHALNIRMVAYKAAEALERPLSQLNMIVMHLGSGVSVNALKRGRMVDTNNANDGGPFSSTRTGGLPLTGLLKLCFSGEYTQSQLKTMFLKQGGLLAYLGKEHLLAVREMVLEGDRQADLVLRAMAYQMAKEAGAMAAALSGRVDAVVITGGMANNEWLTGVLQDHLSFIAGVMVFPGEAELEALVRGVLRVMDGVEAERTYI